MDLLFFSWSSGIVIALIVADASSALTGLLNL